MMDEKFETYWWDAWIMERGYGSMEELIKQKSPREIRDLIRQATNEAWQEGKASAVDGQGN